MPGWFRWTPEREQIVVTAYREGKSDEEIASLLGTTRYVVSYYLKRKRLEGSLPMERTAGSQVHPLWDDAGYWQQVRRMADREQDE